jgi:hypothetical protein
MPMFSHILFGVYLGAFMWAGLWLRTPQLRGLIPLRRRQGDGVAQENTGTPPAVQ